VAEIQELVEAYRQGALSRRDFIRRVIMVAGGLAAALPFLTMAGIPEAEAAQVDPNDPTLESRMVQFPGKAGTVWAYQSRPKAQGNYPAIIVIHDTEGISSYAEDLARRYAREGYVALCVDYLSRHGGTAKAPGRDAQRGFNVRQLVPPEVIKEDTGAAVAYVKTVPGVRADRLGLTGFCWGGEMAFYAATQVRGFKALVVFYGSAPQPLDLLREVEGPVLAHYGEKDPRVTGGVPATEEAMRRFGKSYTYKIYPNAQHAFHHDTRADRYHPEAAKEAWERTLAFFAQHLKA
jgi:carboxymethylenebutenolidase